MSEVLTTEETEALYKKIAITFTREINSGNLDDLILHQSTKDAFWRAVENIEDEDCEDIDADFVVFEIPNVESENLIFNTVEQEGGEGEGDYAYTVIFFHDKLNEREGKHYKFEYSYYSYSGFNLDCVTVTEVKPVLETVTVYK